MIALVLALAAAQQVPAANEQLLIYELNRARNNPDRYFLENNLNSLVGTVAPSPPLAVNGFLVQSAGFHAEEMAANNYFGHQSQVTGDWPNKMARDAGYVLPAAWPNDQNFIESLAAGYTNVLAALRGLIEDAGVNPPGHREHLLATGSSASFWLQHREIGTGYAFNAASTFDHYYAIHTAYVNTSDLFLTGVVYNDANGNGRFDLNEGLGGVTVSRGAASVLSNAAGGWSMPITNGSYTLTVSGGTFAGTATASVTVSGSNVAIDFESGSAAGEVSFSNQPVPAAPAITSSAVTAATAGQAYSYDVNASGYPAPTFALTVFPTGMTINATTGVISWTPTAGQAGSNNVTVTATNALGSTSQSFTVNVSNAPAITSSPVTSALAGSAYSYDVNATGNPAPTFALTVFPAGMTINAATGLISWTPTAGQAGPNSVTVAASNGVGSDATQTFTVTVNLPPTITSSPVTAATAGQAYGTDVNATGFPAPTYALTVFPAGMTINATTGVISWTPTGGQAGPNSVTVTASNGIGSDATQSFTVTVSDAPAITSTPVTTALAGSAYSYDVNATGNPAATFSLTVFPAGMTIDGASGVISWTPTAGQAGPNSVAVTATNGVSPDGTQSFTVSVSAPPAITSSPVTTATSGVAYSTDVNSSGFPAPTYALTVSPAGMTINTTTGVVSWTPTAGQSGANNVTVTATNGVGSDATQSFTVDVSVPPAITSTPVTTALAGSAYSSDVNATGNPAPTYALTVFPTGMAINTTSGVITWTPTAGQAGANSVTVTAANGVGTDATQSFTVSVSAPPTITSTPVTAATAGVTYSYDVNASGFPASTFSLPTAPSGMTIDAATGVISWTPTALQAGANPVTVLASNGASPDSAQSFSVNVSAPPTITSTPITAATAGSPYAYDADAAGNPAPSFVLTAGPAGMSINGGTGVVAWAPAAGDVGQHGVTVTATNGVSPNAVQAFTLTVVPAGPAPNDALSSAVALAGAGVSTAGTTFGSTKEPGEPDHAGNPGGASIWWTWTAPDSGMVTISTLGSSFDTLLAVYLGNSIASLVPVASNDNASGLTSSVTFAAVGGATYLIAVDGFAGAGGSVALSIGASSAPLPPLPEDEDEDDCGLTGLEALAPLLFLALRRRRDRV